MNIKTKTISYRKLMILSICLFVFVLFTYAFLMNKVVSTGKKLTQLETSVMEVQSNIMEIEQQLVAQRRDVSKEEAFVSGFVEPTEVAYIKIDSIKTAFLNE